MVKKLIFSIVVLLVMLVIPVTANEVYLAPQDSNVTGCGDDVAVEVWVNITEAFTGGTINFTYCSECANVTNWVCDVAVWPIQSRASVAGKEWLTFGTFVSKTGKVLIGTFTIECISTEPYCETPLVFGEQSVILSPYPATPLDVDWDDGTFTCGEPVESECLGECYEGTVCEGTSIGKMSCSECLAVAGRSWENDPCPVSACGCTCDSMCWNNSIGGCPECCDGIDNDGVNGTDWPADPKCACCIDQTETVDDGCSTPCVPELPTLALAGIGILGIALLARKRD